MDPNKVNESLNDENDSDQQDDNFEDEITTNELTVKSISELTPHRLLFSIKPGFPRPKSCGGKFVLNIFFSNSILIKQQKLFIRKIIRKIESIIRYGWKTYRHHQ